MFLLNKLIFVDGTLGWQPADLYMYTVRDPVHLIMQGESACN